MTWLYVMFLIGIIQVLIIAATLGRLSRTEDE